MNDSDNGYDRGDVIVAKQEGLRELMEERFDNTDSQLNGIEKEINYVSERVEKNEDNIDKLQMFRTRVITLGTAAVVGLQIFFGAIRTKLGF